MLKKSFLILFLLFSTPVFSKTSEGEIIDDFLTIFYFGQNYNFLFLKQGCIDDDDIKNGHIKIKNNKIFYWGNNGMKATLTLNNNKIMGKFIFNYNHDKIRCEGYIEKDEEAINWFYKNGQKAAEFYYKHPKTNNIDEYILLKKTFYSDGKLKSLLSGNTYEEYYENGKIKSKANIGGLTKMIIEKIDYYPNGTIQKETKFTLNGPTESIFYTSTGEISLKLKYSNNEIESGIRYFTENSITHKEELTHAEIYNMNLEISNTKEDPLKLEIINPGFYTQRYRNTYLKDKGN